MDFRRAMRIAYYLALHGNLTVGGVAIPIIYDMAQKGVNPDVFGLLSVVANTADDTLHSLNRIYVTQFTIVAKNTNIADNETVDQLASQFYSVVQPSKNVTGVNPVGFQIVYTKITSDVIRPTYETSTGKIVVERVIQIENRINQV